MNAQPMALERVILETIRGETITTQHQLLAALRSAGVVLSQATLSRLLKKLGVLRGVLPDGRRAYQPSTDWMAQHPAWTEQRAAIRSLLSGDSAGEHVMVLASSQPAEAAALLRGLGVPGVVDILPGPKAIWCAVTAQGKKYLQSLVQRETL